tara:strand:- start:16834 stop:16968 length:135 start_codon:yes stop_codon:yes gene_type:complete
VLEVLEVFELNLEWDRSVMQEIVGEKRLLPKASIDWLYTSIIHS